MIGQAVGFAVAVGQRWWYWGSRHWPLVLLSGVGVAGLYSGLGLTVTLAVVGAAIVIDLLARVSQFFRALGLVLGTIAVPWLCLLGFDVLLALVLSIVPIPKPGLLLGLLLGIAVFAAVAARLLVLWDDRLWIAIGTGLLLAPLNLVVPPLVIGSREKTEKVKPAQAIVFQLDATIVVPGRTADVTDAVQEGQASPDWDVQFSVARASAGRDAQWLVLDTGDAEAAQTAALGSGPAISGQPERRPGADQLVLLDVDGTPPVTPRPWELPEAAAKDGEIDRWMATVARMGVPAKTPVVALVQTTDGARLRAWNAALRRYGGFAISIQQRRARSITDAVLHAAIKAPTADEDLAIALRLRPVLLFDRTAKRGNDTPLDVDALLGSGLVELCHEDREFGSHPCERVGGAKDLVNGDRYLKVSKEAAKRDLPTRIYVHPTRTTVGDRELLYLDYWWYLLSNPNEVGLGGFCGAGLSLPGITCFAHDSDWEGVTVVADVSGRAAVPVAVQYAQHSDVIRYAFAQLRDGDWADDEIKDLLDDVGVKRIDAVDRPLVFVASGSHASFPTPCFRDCRQRAKQDTGEDHHDGRHEPTWTGNDANRCHADCVRLTPTRLRGNEPALWNAFDGVWGERSCILISYCNAEVSPAAPGTQKRYKDPTRITGYVDAAGAFVRCREGETQGKLACPPLPPAR